MLEKLPPELITAIFEDLPRSDVASSATISRAVASVAERSLYCNLVVDYRTAQALANTFRTTGSELAALVTSLEVTDKSKSLDIHDSSVGYVCRTSSSSSSSLPPSDRLDREGFGKALCFILACTQNIVHLSLLFTIPNQALPIYHTWGEILSEGRLINLPLRTFIICRSINTKNRIPKFLSKHPGLTSVELRFPEILEPPVPALSLTDPIHLPAMRNFDGDLAVLLACVPHSPELVNVRTDVRTVKLGDASVFRTLAEHMKNIQRLAFLTDWPLGELLSVTCSCFSNIRALRISKSVVSSDVCFPAIIPGCPLTAVFVSSLISWEFQVKCFPGSTIWKSLL